MIPISSNTRIFICNYPTSMKKSFEGLSVIVEQLFPGEIFSGAFFVFLNRQRDHMKILLWDGDGFVIYYKRLEEGVFKWNFNDLKTIDRKSFLMILEGITPKKLEKRYVK